MCDTWSVRENWAWVICVWCLYVCVSVVCDMCVACPWNKLHAAIAPYSDSLREIPVHAHIRPHTHEPGGESPPLVHTCHGFHVLITCTTWSSTIAAKPPKVSDASLEQCVWAGTNEWLHLQSFKSSPQGCCTNTKYLVQHCFEAGGGQLTLLWLVSSHCVNIHCTHYILTGIPIIDCMPTTQTCDFTHCLMHTSRTHGDSDYAHHTHRASHITHRALRITHTWRHSFTS